jgi:hypothetical protein
LAEHCSILAEAAVGGWPGARLEIRLDKSGCYG